MRAYSFDRSIAIRVPMRHFVHRWLVSSARGSPFQGTLFLLRQGYFGDFVLGSVKFGFKFASRSSLWRFNPSIFLAVLEATADTMPFAVMSVVASGLVRQNLELSVPSSFKFMCVLPVS